MDYISSEVQESFSFFPFFTQFFVLYYKRSYRASEADTALLLARMASASAGSSRDAGAAPPVAVGTPLNATAGAPVDTTQLDKLCEKALTASSSGRHALTSSFFRRAAEEALRLHGETFVCTYLTLHRALSLGRQSEHEGVTKDKAALDDEAWALASGCLPLIVRRMDDNTMLPGRGTAVELAFFKRFTATRDTMLGDPPASSRELQLVGLSLGYATALRAAHLLLALLTPRREVEARKPLFCAWWTAYCQPHEACQASLLKKRSLLLIVFKMHFLVLFHTTQRLWPLSDQNGRVRRWCRCAGNVACWMYWTRSTNFLKSTQHGGVQTSRSMA